MRILGWAAWVDTETGTEIYSSKETEWADLPDDGIIYIMLYKDEGDGQNMDLNGDRYTHREEMCGVDYYFMAPHRSGIPIYGSNNDSLSSIKKRYPGAVIKKGKWIPAELFKQVQIEAITHVW